MIVKVLDWACRFLQLLGDYPCVKVICLCVDGSNACDLAKIACVPDDFACDLANIAWIIVNIPCNLHFNPQIKPVNAQINRVQRRENDWL